MIQLNYDSESESNFSEISNNSDYYFHNDDSSDSSNQNIEEINAPDVTIRKNEISVLELIVPTDIEQSGDELNLYDFSKDLKVTRVLSCIDSFICDDRFDRDLIDAITYECKQPSLDKQTNINPSNSENRDRYHDFIYNLAKDKDGKFMKHETYISDVFFRKCVTIMLKDMDYWALFEIISTYIITMMYMSSKNDVLFERVMRLMEHHFEDQKNVKFIWIFLIIYFSLDEYQSISKMLKRKICWQNIGRKDTLIFSQMMTYKIISIQNERRYKKKIMKKLIDFVIDLHQSNMIQISQMFWFIFNRKGTNFNFFNRMMSSCHKTNDYSLIETMKQYSSHNTYHNFTMSLPLVGNSVSSFNLNTKKGNRDLSSTLKNLGDDSNHDDMNKRFERMMDIFSGTKWISQIILDMTIVNKNNLLQCLEQLWSLLQQNKTIYRLKIKKTRLIIDSSSEESTVIPEKIMDIYEYCFYKENKQMIEQITNESMKKREHVDDLIKKINACVHERNYMVEQFTVLLKNEKYDLCDLFLQENQDHTDFIFFNCFSKTITTKLNDVRCINMLLKYDFDWSCSQPHDNRLYENIFHVLIETSNFKENAAIYCNLFKAQSIHLRYQQEWNAKNQLGISINDFCDFLGYGHLFSTKDCYCVEKREDSNLDQNIWNNIVEFIEFDNSVHYSFWLSRINKCTNALAQQIYHNELEKLFESKPHSLQHFAILFCSLFYKLNTVKEILLHSFYNNLCLSKEDAYSIIEESEKWDHDSNNKIVHFQKTVDLIVSRESMMENIEKCEMKSEGIELELFEFSKNHFFDFFGLKIDHFRVQHFMCVFVGNIQMKKKHLNKNKSSMNI